MKKLLSILALTAAMILAPAVTEAQLSRSIITKTFTFTSSTNTSSYTLNYPINAYSTTKTAYSLDIGVPYTSIVDVEVVTTHTGTPVMAVQLFTASVAMPGDNGGPIALLPTDLNTTYLASVPISSVGSLTGVSSATSTVYHASSIPATAYFKGQGLYFILQNKVANGTPSSSAQYLLRFTLKKE